MLGEIREIGRERMKQERKEVGRVVGEGGEGPRVGGGN